MNANSPGQAYGAETDFGPQITFDPISTDKDELFRAILVFDISQLSPGTVQSATLEMECTSFIAATPANVARSGRASTWAEITVTWNSYAGVLPWSVAGGERDQTTPPSVSFTTPVATGPFTFPDLSAHAQDAIDNRAGFMSIILSLDDESSQPDRGCQFAAVFLPGGDPAELVVVMAS